jgi:spore coat polysaccharide biosynthesis protein SpsF
MKNICFIQARMSSTRLPGKSMLDLAGKTLLERVIESVQKAKFLDKIVVLTSTDFSDNLIEQKCKSININVFRGYLHNVLRRFYDAAKIYDADYYFRVTADNPLTPAFLIDELAQAEIGDYACSEDIPVGTKVEKFSKKALEEAYKNAKTDYEKEHVTPYMIKNFGKNIIKSPEKIRFPELRATVDTLEDYLQMAEFYNDALFKKISPEILEYIQYMPMISSKK